MVLNTECAYESTSHKSAHHLAQRLRDIIIVRLGCAANCCACRLPGKDAKRSRSFLDRSGGSESMKDARTASWGIRAAALPSMHKSHPTALDPDTHPSCRFASLLGETPIGQDLVYSFKRLVAVGTAWLG